MRREPTLAQKQAAKERRERMRAIAKGIAEMTEEQRVAFAGRRGINTIEGRSLSLFNQCMILTQDPAASVVGGFRQWRTAGRQVRRGSRGLAIWIPIAGGSSVEQQPGAEDMAEEGGKPARCRFVLGTVFDVSQTDPAECESEALASVGGFDGGDGIG